jgi:hypothetical protein
METPMSNDMRKKVPINAGVVRDVNELIDELVELDARLDPDATHAALDAAVTTEMAKYVTSSGIDGAPSGLAQRVRDHHATQHDMAVTSDATRLGREMRATERDAERRLEESRRAKAEPNDNHEMVLYRRLDGRPLSYLAKAYERGDDALLVKLVEDELGEKEPDLRSAFRLRESDDDSMTMMRLSRLTQQRQSEREDKSVATRLEALRAFRETSRRLSTVLRMAHDGKRIDIARARHQAPRSGEAS